MSKRILVFTVNDEEYELAVKPRDTLLDILRDKLGLTGTKEGCGSGECGSCTVLLDNEPVLACLTLAVDVHGKKVQTIEGLEKEAELHPVQKAFVEAGAIQCGYCTPGMVMAAKSLLDRKTNPSREEIKEALGGHICRCTGYVKIVEAVEAAGKEKRVHMTKRNDNNEIKSP